MRVVYAIVVVAVLSACAPSGDTLTDAPWQLVELTTDGVTETVEIGVNTAVTPWIEFDTEVSGNAGCNKFATANHSPYVHEDGVLLFGEIGKNISGCMPAGRSGEDGVMSVEHRLSNAIANAEGIEVTTLTDAEMVWWWEGGATEFVFTPTAEG